MLILSASNSSDWSNSALDVSSLSCCLTSLLSSNKSEVALSKIWNSDSARSVFAFARHLFAHRRQTFIFLGSVAFLFCCSNWAIANSVFHNDAVNWQSIWVSQVPTSVWTATEFFSTVSGSLKLAQELEVWCVRSYEVLGRLSEEK